MPAATAYRVTIGLEVHCQVKSRTKMFCACRTSFGAEPNTNVCPVCLGLPGALPVVNGQAIRQTILAGLMLGCRIPEVTTWDRKNYFYPDMPKNYQLSQLHHPLCWGGQVELDTLHYPKDAQKSVKAGRVIRIHHIHLEEDVGKSTHYENNSLIDFNRAGTPLMEIVSEPDMETPEEAVAFLNALRQTLVYGGVSDADMEKGQMRCDVNVSLRPDGQEELGPKVELKNLNSISAVRRALEHEIERQSAELDLGILQVQSTRRWDDDLGETQLMRTKEDAHDYRYFPDPDLVPVATATMIEDVLPRVPELPAAKRSRFIEEYGVTAYDAGVLASERALADWFERAAAGAAAPKKIANWAINELLGKLNEASLAIADCPIEPSALRALVDMIEGGKVSQSQAKEIFAELFGKPGSDPATIAREKGFEQVSDSSALLPVVRAVLAEFPDKATEAAGGEAKVLNWLTGQVMKRSGGKANPRMVAELLQSLLRGP
jgi:aspartyl-tRNA(Asn)/glutamyl-tRNA(Gln) amidotransferase subunit B